MEGRAHSRPAERAAMNEWDLKKVKDTEMRKGGYRRETTKYAKAWRSEAKVTG